MKLKLSQELKDKFNLESDEISHLALKELMAFNSDSVLELRKHVKLLWPVKPAKKEKSKEYLAMMQKAQNIVDEREYRQMTVGLESDAESNWNPKEWKQVQSQLSGLANVALSVGAVITAVFMLGVRNPSDLMYFRNMNIGILGCG